MDNISFENLNYSAYELVFDHSYEFSENVKYATADFNKLYLRRLRLPDGKNNLIYLLTDTFENGIKLINSGNFLIPPTYRRIFYPTYMMGSFLNKRYRISTQKSRNERNQLIKSNTKLVPVQTRTIPRSKENLFFVTADIYQGFLPIMSKAPIKKLYDGFFKEFVSVLTNNSPEKVSDENPGSANRILIIDADAFAFKNKAPVAENKVNPLYLLYLAYLRNKNLSTINVDIDMLICSKNLFIKFNPSKLTIKDWPIFRKALFRIMDANLDNYTDELPEEEKKELEETANDKVLHSIVKNAVEPYTSKTSGSTTAVVQDVVERKLRQQAALKIKQDAEMKLAVPERKDDNIDKFVASLPTSSPSSVLHSNPIKKPLSQKQLDMFKPLAQYDRLTDTTDIEIDDDDYDEYEFNEEEEEAIANDATEILANDEEVAEEIMDEIQDEIAPLDSKTAPINSERDKKLREAQKKIIVGNETIETILQRSADDVKIEEDDKSKVMKTSNQNMKHIKFANFEKTYLDELYVKDILSCFDMLKDKESPFYITNIERKDTSTTLDYKETWTVTLVDEVGKKHTMKVDIPKFQNDRFMLINGTRFMILKQNFFNPLVKDTPDVVILTTNYNKITITRKSTKSINSIERIFSLIKKSGDSSVFTVGDSSNGNTRTGYINTLEYDELSRRLFTFTSGNCTIYFSRDYIKDHIEIPKGVKGDEFFIGYEGKTPIIINEDTGLDKQGRTIVQIIEQNLSEELRSIYNNIKGPKQSMYVEGTLAGVDIPVITTLMIWNGLTKTLDRMGMRWHFVPKDKKNDIVPGMSNVKFANGTLQYETQIFAELLLNGLTQMHPERYNFEDFDSEAGYDEFMYMKWGSYNGITEIKTFDEFLMDPITKSVCQQMLLPDDSTGLMIHGVKMLADNQHNSKASDNSYRVRSIEMIPAILYSCIANQYKSYVKSGRRKPMTLNQRCLISKLMAEKTVETYSVLNPVIEVSKTHTISMKGYRGSNSEYSYDEEKRSYDPSSVGKLAISTSADANVGVNKNLVVEPTIKNARGFREPVEDTEALKDVNVFSPVEMLTPGTARGDDPIRTAINNLDI